MKLIRNRVKCLACDEVIESNYRHDYKTCGCPNETMVDGGIDYQRFGGADLKLVEPLPEFTEDDTFIWWIYDHKLGHTVPRILSDLEDSHIQNIDLHLRRRCKDKDSKKYAIDQQTRQLYILPELKRRKLPKINKEIKYETKYKK
jgi:hypothetical protein